MRSGSSLLTRILVSHPEIAGYGELHRTYPTVKHFASLHADVAKAHPWKALRSRYVLDKILHNGYLSNSDVLSADNVRVIFLLRDPVEAVSSLMLRLAHGSRSMRRYADLDYASEYYISRLQVIRSYADDIGEGRAVTVTYSNLIDNPSDTLASLTGWLRLQSPLKSNYSVDRFTGTRGVGDSSKYITRGEIVRERSGEVLEFDESLRLRLAEAYRDTMSQLSNRFALL